MILSRITRKLRKCIIGKLSPVRYARSIGVKVGENCILESVNFDTEPWLIEIGNHVEITGNVQFITHDGATWTVRNQEKYKDILKFGKIILKDNCYIGRQSILLPGVCIGENAIVGAGSVVTKSVDDNCVVAGNPAKFICTTEEYAEKAFSNMPKYDMDNYRTNKRAEVLRALGEKG